MSDGRDKLNDFSLLKSLIGNRTTKNKKNRSCTRADTVSANGKDKKNYPEVGGQEKFVNLNTRRNKNSLQRKSNPYPKTKLRMPQYGQKHTNEFSNESLPEAPKEQQEIVIYIDAEKQRLKDEHLLFTWLCQRFSKCFNPKDKRPLKIGISDDIEKIYQNEYRMHIDQYILHNVIKRYVGDTRYQRAVIEHKKRFDLNGTVVDYFSNEHLDYAQKRLDEIAEKAKLRAQGVDIKTYYQQKHAAARAQNLSHHPTETNKTTPDRDKNIHSPAKDIAETSITPQQSHSSQL